MNNSQKYKHVHASTIMLDVHRTPFDDLLSARSLWKRAYSTWRQSRSSGVFPSGQVIRYNYKTDKSDPNPGPSDSCS